MLHCHNPYYSAQSAFNLNMVTAGKKRDSLVFEKKSQDIIYEQILCFPLIFDLFQRSKHVCDADRKVTIHSRALPHHYTLQQNEDKRHESHS